MRLNLAGVIHKYCNQFFFEKLIFKLISIYKFGFVCKIQFKILKTKKKNEKIKKIFVTYMIGGNSGSGSSRSGSRFGQRCLRISRYPCFGKCFHHWLKIHFFWIFLIWFRWNWYRIDFSNNWWSIIQMISTKLSTFNYIGRLIGLKMRSRIELSRLITAWECCLFQSF